MTPGLERERVLALVGYWMEPEIRTGRLLAREQGWEQAIAQLVVSFEQD